EFLFNKGYFNSVINNIATRPPLSPAVTIFLNKRNGLISSEDSAAGIAQLAATDGRTQFEKYFQRTGITQQHALSVRGGSAWLSWLLAGNYNRVLTTNSSKNEKINLHLDNNIRISRKLTVSLGAYYTSSQSKSGMPGF